VRNYAAALDPANGALLPWNPNIGGVVKGIAVTNSNVYFSGSFSNIAGQSRRLLGAVSEATAEVQPWDAAAVGSEIFSLIAANDTLYAGGAFSSVNGRPNYNFARIAPTTITVGVGGTGSGTVQAASMGISCGVATCANQVLEGTNVELTAVPDQGSQFDSWTGACSAETQPTCTVSVSEARTVTAVFTSMASAPGPTPAPGADPGTPAADGPVPSTGATQQQASRTPIAWRVGKAALRSQGRTRLAVGERIQLSRNGRYTLIYVDSAGKRVPLAKGTRIASRKLNKTFYAPVMNVTGPDSLKISAQLARPGAKAITLRVILRNPDGTLQGEDIPLR
jgi:Divergent InlB B-repeat domain